MSTNGRIGVLRPDGRVESIYNHYDSYLDGAGAALKNIRDPKLVDELIKLGDRRGIYADEDWRDKESLFNEPSRFHNSEDEFFNDSSDWSSYKYLFKDGQWFVGERDGGGFKISPLTGEPFEKQVANAIKKPTFGGKIKTFKSALDQADDLVK